MYEQFWDTVAPQVEVMKTQQTPNLAKESFLKSMYVNVIHFYSPSSTGSGTWAALFSAFHAGKTSSISKSTSTSEKLCTRLKSYRKKGKRKYLRESHSAGTSSILELHNAKDIENLGISHIIFSLESILMFDTKTQKYQENGDCHCR